MKKHFLITFTLVLFAMAIIAPLRLYNNHDYEGIWIAAHEVFITDASISITSMIGASALVALLVTAMDFLYARIQRK